MARAADLEDFDSLDRRLCDLQSRAAEICARVFGDGAAGDGEAGNGGAEEGGAEDAAS